jgi:hypothetical protein
LLEGLKFFIIVNELHVVVVLFSFLVVQGGELGFKIKGSSNLIWELNLGDYDIFEINTFICEHFVQELSHGSSVSGTLDLINFQVGFTSNQNSDSFGNGSFELLIQLVNTNLVAEVLDGFVSFFFVVWVLPNGENNCNIEGNEDVIVSWAGSDWETEDNILFGDQELNFGPWHADVETAFVQDLIKSTVGGDDAKGSLRTIN